MDGYTYLIKVDTNGNVVLPALSKNAKQADKSIGHIDSSSKKSFGTLGQSANRSNAILRKTKGLLAGIGITMSAGALATGIVKTGANFQKTMSGVQAKMRATSDEMNTLTNKAREMGESTQFSASEAGEALDFMAMAGYNTNQAVSALPGTLNLAAASGLDLGKSADIATNILSQFRMQADDTGEVVDKLAYTATSANTSMEEMADAMNYFGPTAASMNISLSESLGTIGLLADAGKKGSVATRALRSSLTRLANPTNKMQQTMAGLNVSFYDANGNFVGIANMVEQLNAKMEGLSQRQKTAAVSTLFGNEAIDSMNILLTAGADELRAFTGELDNATGAAKKMAEIKVDNLAGDFTKLKSASQELQLQLFDHIGPTLRTITQEATLFIRSLDTEQVGLQLKKTILTLRRGLVWFVKNRRVIVGLVKGYVALKAGMMAYNVVIKAGKAYTAAATLAKWGYVAATRGAAVATRALNTTLKFSPVGALVGLLSAAASAMLLFRDRTKQATNAQKELNQQKIKDQMLKQDVKEMVTGSRADMAKLSMNLDERQIKNLRQEAKMRLEKAQDLMLDVKSRAKTSEDFKEYKRLLKKQAATDYSVGDDGKIKNSGLTNREFSRLEVLKKKINEMPKNVTGLSIKQIKDLQQKNKKILQQTSGLVKEEDTTLGGASAGDTGSPTATGMSERVSAGGSRQRVVNISLGKFMEDIIFNVNNSTGEVQSKAEEVKDIFMQQYMRVLNSANQMANG